MKESNHLNVGKDMAREKLSNTSKKCINWYSNIGEKYLVKGKMQITYILTIPLLNRVPRKTLTCV